MANALFVPRRRAGWQNQNVGIPQRCACPEASLSVANGAASGLEYFGLSEERARPVAGTRLHAM
jgi:hypothetical protein